MKKIYIIGLLAITLGNFIACNNDFMEKYPLDAINDTNYWKTENDLKIYANQFYPNIMDKVYAYSDDDASDNQANRNKDSYLWSEYTVPTSDGGWAKGDWNRIRSCNYFLEHYGTVTGVQATINTYVGEIMYFKASLYFDKVKKFGDVPWLSKELTISSEELYKSRDSRKLVMDSVCDLLDKAINYLPEASSEGRLTRNTALALKSRACLYEGTYRKYHNLGDYESMLHQSVEASKKIIDSGLFELYSTGNPEDDYHELFQKQDLAGVKEAIFYVEYIADKRQHNRVRQCRESGSGMTKDFVESYLCTDGQPIALSPLYKGDNNFTDEFENRDSRMKQTIYTPDRPIFITETGGKEYETAPIYNNNVSTGYRMYKMYNPSASDNEYEKCTIDICIFRFGEILLNYAEAKAELGECDQTILDQTINKLRNRANMPTMSVEIQFVDPNWPKWEIAVSPLINEIRRERRIELASEGFRWDDLCRWKAGKLLENTKTYLGARDPETGEYKNIYSVNANSRKWYDKMYLRPIPTDEINYNPNLTQNPGWE